MSRLIHPLPDTVVNKRINIALHTVNLEWGDIAGEPVADSIGADIKANVKADGERKLDDKVKVEGTMVDI
jgi:hypothetical protein